MKTRNGITKARMILDSKQSGVKTVTSQAQRVPVPRLFDAILQILCLLTFVAAGVNDVWEMVEAFVLEISDVIGSRQYITRLVAPSFTNEVESLLALSRATPRDKRRQDELDWYMRLAQFECETVHLARALIVNPEILVLTKPVDEVVAEN